MNQRGSNVWIPQFIRGLTSYPPFLVFFFLQDWYYRIAGYPTKSLKGELVLITGAGGGLGRLLAIRMTRLGAKLILWDISKEGECELFLEVWIYLTWKFYLPQVWRKQRTSSKRWVESTRSWLSIFRRKKRFTKLLITSGRQWEMWVSRVLFSLFALNWKTVEMSKGSSCISSSE